MELKAERTFNLPEDAKATQCPACLCVVFWLAAAGKSRAMPFDASGQCHYTTCQAVKRDA